ncbi:hypothetical protein LUZ60_012435 [Juncus effusus]|nr:hypothetical protein LUZ60_012435 [Juncus effusus]
MLRMRGFVISKKKLMLDIHLFLSRGKVASRSFIHHLTHQNHRNYSSRTSREVEFSCSNTPSFPSFNLPKRKRNHHKNPNHDNYFFYNLDAREIAKSLEVLNENELSSYVESPVWGFGKSPMPTERQLRITDSPFMMTEEEGEMDKEIDTEAENFIKRFYEQLRSQGSIPATPMYELRA